VSNLDSWPLSTAAVIMLFASIIESPGGAGTDTNRQGPEPNSCGLLTDEQISEAMNMKVDPGAREDSGRLDGRVYEGAYSSTCVWRASQDRGAHDSTRPLGGANFAILTLISWPAGGNGPAMFLQSFRDAAESHIIASAPVTLRIGDEALWWGDGVAARKGNVSFGISIHLLNGRAKERQMEESLAAKIAARL
jgi:hypothetical protein